MRTRCKLEDVRSTHFDATELAVTGCHMQNTRMSPFRFGQLKRIKKWLEEHNEEIFIAREDENRGGMGHTYIPNALKPVFMKWTSGVHASRIFSNNYGELFICLVRYTISQIDYPGNNIEYYDIFVSTDVAEERITRFTSCPCDVETFSVNRLDAYDVLEKLEMDYGKFDGTPQIFSEEDIIYIKRIITDGFKKQIWTKEMPKVQALAPKE